MIGIGCLEEGAESPARGMTMTRTTSRLLIGLILSVGLASCQGPVERAGGSDTPAIEDASERLLSRIDSIREVSISEATIEMTFTQPVDHDNPAAGSFDQRIILVHKGFDKPLVLWLEGYAGGNRREQELTRLLDANQLSIEHRYFGESTPDPLNWDHLTIEQAAADHHRIVEAFKPIYTGKWVNSGISKGGQTTMYHRRFYPEDVDASVCYVAPLNFSIEEPRFVPFFEQVGTESRRSELLRFQKLVLEKKDELLPLFREYSKGKGFTYEIGAEAAFEYCALEYSFSYWQFHEGVTSAIPPDSSGNEEIFAHFVDAVNPYYFSDTGVSDLTPFFHQALTQIGYYGYDLTPFSGLLTAVADPTYQFCAPPGTDPVFDPEAMRDVHRWITTEGNNMIFIYGEVDPWSASAVHLTGQTNSFTMVKEGGDHSTRIRDFGEEEQERILGALQEWLDIEVD